MIDEQPIDEQPIDEEAVDFVGLPPRPDPATWVAEAPSEPVPDPDGGRNPERDFLLRNAGA